MKKKEKYGSHSRGDFSEDSDIDIVAIVDLDANLFYRKVFKNIKVKMVLKIFLLFLISILTNLVGCYRLKTWSAITDQNGR